MLELLAAIQSVDPPSLVLWGMVLFAAGMYPVGFMLGASCSPCCGQPCSACTQGSLPDTVTVTFDGFSDQTPGGPSLVNLAFASCFGGGAAASVGLPGGKAGIDNGPISFVKLTNSGSGYAKLGRVPPTLSVSGGSGSGATFTPTLTVANDACGIPTWSIASVAASGGAGYVGNETLTVKVAAGDTQTTAAVLRVQTAARSQPTLSASATTGSGATFAVTTTSNGGTPETWRVSGVTVSGTTSGYVEGEKLAFTGGTESVAADVRIRTDLVEPTVTASVSGGSGASLAVSLTKSGDRWGVAGVGVTSGGTGYTDGDPVTFTVTDGTQEAEASAAVSVRAQPSLTPSYLGSSGTGATITATTARVGEYWRVSSLTITAAGSGYVVDDFFEFLLGSNDAAVEIGSAWVTAVDGSGAITAIEVELPGYGYFGGEYFSTVGPIDSVSVTAAGSYYKGNGVIQSLELVSGGQYYGRTGTPVGVTITNGGAYYREDVDVAPVTVTITQVESKSGTGAVIAATVDGDRYSGTFGQVTALTITNGGNNYVAVIPADDPCNLFP